MGLILSLNATSLKNVMGHALSTSTCRVVVQWPWWLMTDAGPGSLRSLGDVLVALLLGRRLVDRDVAGGIGRWVVASAGGSGWNGDVDGGWLVVDWLDDWLVGGMRPQPVPVDGFAGPYAG
ncbi:unnamed protein product [Heligmosomoides polygyrus]|uniref:Secreted protein n=1 Tax=Heligmosomoides polygyrus TaxID=6339 RepID=A0A183G8G4_HELPZ|nr:unnamed protein product [Heligmosomoides polygyrus]